MKYLLTFLICGLTGLGDASAQAALAQDYVLVVGAGSPYQTAGELVKAARSGAVGLLCGAGRGTPGCDGFAKATGVKVESVMYRGTIPVLNDVVSRSLDFGLISADDAKALVGNSKLRILR